VPPVARMSLVYVMAFSECVDTVLALKSIEETSSWMVSMEAESIQDWSRNWSLDESVMRALESLVRSMGR